MNNIAKIIHQTYGQDLTEDLLCNINYLKVNNPTWEYRLYDEQDILDFIKEKYGNDILNTYLSINPKYGATRADFFRYLLVYHYGGVYLDIKSTVTKPLDDVIKPDDHFILSQWDNGPGEEYSTFGRFPELFEYPDGEFQQWHVISEPKHTFLEEVIKTSISNIKNYDSNRDGVGFIGGLKLTGPIIYTLTIGRLLNIYPHRFVKNKDFGLKYTVFTNAIAHRKLFKTHYTQLKEPLVIM